MNKYQRIRAKKLHEIAAQLAAIWADGGLVAEPSASSQSGKRKLWPSFVQAMRNSLQLLRSLMRMSTVEQLRGSKMQRREMLLAALASGSRDVFSPVQLQKMMFLLDKNLGEDLGGPFFNFQPYDYGPFDATVYNEFDAMALEGLSKSSGQGRERTYRLTEIGKRLATNILQNLADPHRRYFSDVAQFVQQLSFTALVASIYRSYPEMKVNSVFRESA